MSTQEQEQQGTEPAHSTARHVTAWYVATVQRWVSVTWSDEYQCYIASNSQFVGLEGYGDTPEDACNDYAVAALCREMRPE